MSTKKTASPEAKKYPADKKQPYGDLESQAGAGSSSAVEAAEPLLLLDPLTADGSALSTASPDDAELPSYADIDAPTHSYPSEPPSFSHYVPTTHTITNGKVISHDAHLNSDTEALFQWLTQHTSLPPSPLLKVEGTHSSTRTVTRDGKTETESTTVTDFSMTFSLSHLLTGATGVLSPATPPQRRHRGTRRARAANPAALEDALTLRDWCAAYIASRSVCKEFALRKRVDAIPQEYITDHIAAAIRATNYQGHLAITFPLQDRSVVLAPENWIARARYGPWRWFFYLSFLWLLTWPILWAATRRWDVVDAVWTADDAAAKEWVALYARTVGTLARGRRQGAVRYAELEAVREAHMAREAAPREAGEVGAWVGGFLRGMREAQEGWAGGWGADDGFLNRSFRNGGRSRSQWSVRAGTWQVGSG
ncbi:hypothetical protein EDC01DRAFT_791149 [Geopyxis carbonaria]|nr:hypothetical protein EDC01DRAFT_791149 [Geopyxis carbonaria]